MRFAIGMLVGVLALAAGCATKPAYEMAPVSTEGPAPWIWVDSDLAVSPNGMVDPDDLIALELLRATAPERVIGISASAANASLAQTKADLVRYASWAALPPDTQCDTDQPARGAEEPGVKILALGPATNLPGLVECLTGRGLEVKEVVFVGGRQPGEDFWLSGPIPLLRPMKDLNYEADTAGFQEAVGTGVKISLVPFRAGNAVRLGLAETYPVLDATGYEAVRNWIATLSLIGAAGTMPAFDPAAAAYALWPEMFACQAVEVTEMGAQLVVTPDPDARQVRLCHPEDPEAVINMIAASLRQG